MQHHGSKAVGNHSASFFLTSGHKLSAAEDEPCPIHSAQNLYAPQHLVTIGNAKDTCVHTKTDAACMQDILS